MRMSRIRQVYVPDNEQAGGMRISRVHMHRSPSPSRLTGFKAPHPYKWITPSVLRDSQVVSGINNRAVRRRGAYLSDPRRTNYPAIERARSRASAKRACESLLQHGVSSARTLILASRVESSESSTIRRGSSSQALCSGFVRSKGSPP